MFRVTSQYPECRYDNYISRTMICMYLHCSYASFKRFLHCNPLTWLLYKYLISVVYNFNWTASLCYYVNNFYVNMLWSVVSCCIFFIFFIFIPLSVLLCPIGLRPLFLTSRTLGLIQWQASSLQMRPSHRSITLLVYLDVAGRSTAPTKWLREPNFESVPSPVFLQLGSLFPNVECFERSVVSIYRSPVVWQRMSLTLMFTHRY